MAPASWEVMWFWGTSGRGRVGSISNQQGQLRCDRSSGGLVRRGSLAALRVWGGCPVNLPLWKPGAVQVPDCGPVVSPKRSLAGVGSGAVGEW